MSFKINDEVKVARDCYGNKRRDCSYCPPIGLIGTIIKLGKYANDDAAYIDTYHNGKGMIRLTQLEHVGE